MLEYTIRFNVKEGRAREMQAWLAQNESALIEHSRPGWEYLGTWGCVFGFGTHDGEARFALDDYAALGSDLEGEALRVTEELMDFMEDQWQTSLFKTAKDAIIVGE